MVSAATSSYPDSSPPPHRVAFSPQKRTMSITQTYFLAHKARAKLSHEAARPDHNLRLLVGHANLLDSLMLDLADAEREQESWFTQSVRGASPASGKAEERHVQWVDSLVGEEDWDADSSDSDSDLDSDDDVEMEDAVPMPLSRMPSNLVVPPSPILQPMDAEFEDDDEEEDYDSLTLTRSPSHSASPPELEHDSDSSEDESMPPSPPTASIPSFSQKQREPTVATKCLDSTHEEEEEDQKTDFYNEGFYLPPRNSAPMVPSIPAY
ncbi:hypothetical protein DL764_008159 [Monosporascus ibericus]|uniref:Uncharacterized protein n=1 Tax=Monosporascus ibericus TaxID=155417 RepID=A0A4Q4SY82_9PEZI|nr:hypothetical protein DL764_008159 [Monosporascus ibericus]